MRNEIKLRIASGNKGYCALAKLLKTETFIKNIKIISILRLSTIGTDAWV